VKNLFNSIKYNELDELKKKTKDRKKTAGKQRSFWREPKRRQKSAIQSKSLLRIAPVITNNETMF
jgi:hypothetical protein